MVFVHGYSLLSGQPWYADYSGECLARDSVIVVNIGCRLCAFRFLALDKLAAESEHCTTGNHDLLD
ncbi:MAG: carboxylesterase family protein [Clostridia bacterium]|nr:carboxylesterase family protein [Clostridia bacterium]MBR0445626.1 carboxylesterase family protein [Clostridia bacterium]